MSAENKIIPGEPQCVKEPDIVERLRTKHVYGAFEIDQQRQDAADEIERLRLAITKAEIMAIGDAVTTLRKMEGSEDQRIEEMLKDPIVVHLNMLRGTIAKPTWKQIKHLYPEQFHSSEETREAPVDITGWKLVPDQPTEEMWQAGRSADIHPGDSYSKVWSAMFEAAPNVDDCETFSEEAARAFARLFPDYKRAGFTGGQAADYKILKRALMGGAGASPRSRL